MIEIIREETLEEREERRKREAEGKEPVDNKTLESEETESKERETEEKKELGIPKNVRQIGDNGGREKIYIEDYVMTHMKQLAAYGDEKPKVLILYGKKQIIDGQLFWFVSGAVQADAIDSFTDEITIDENLWMEINQTANSFFKGLSIVGWALLRRNSDSYWKEKIITAHKKYFRPGQKVFFEYIINERMEDMYLFEKGKMNRQTGFFIYYERNEPMQNYMVAYKEKETEKEEEFTGDKATKQFRAIVQEKKDRHHKRQTMGLLYGTSFILVLVIMVIGITMLNNYEKMQNMEQVLYKISGQMEDVQTEDASDGNELASANAEAVQTSVASEADETANIENNDNSQESANGQAATQVDNSGSETANQTEEANANLAGSTAGTAATSQEKSEASNTTAAQADNTGNETTANQNESAPANSDDATNESAAANSTNGTNESAPANSADATNESAPANSADATDKSAPANSADTTEGQAVSNQADNATEQLTADTSTNTTSIPKEYIIQKGDTLAKISRKFYGTESMIQKICDLNNIKDMDNILYGEKLILPQL